MRSAGDQKKKSTKEKNPGFWGTVSSECHDDAHRSHKAGEETQSSSAEEFEAVSLTPSSLGHSAFPTQRRRYRPGSNKGLANQQA